MGQNIDIEIKHTDFEKKEIINQFIDKNNNSIELCKILSGDIDSQSEFLFKLLNDVSYEEYSEIKVNNFCYLLGIILSLSDLNDKYHFIENFVGQIGYYPEELIYRDINKICYNNIVKRIFRESFPFYTY